MSEKKILMLGGAHSQIPAIKYAKFKGYNVITCDYLPSNPGHNYADRYYNVSTTDLPGVLKLAKELNIDGIVAYASDPSAPAAAFVSDALDLPGPSYEAVKILSEKDLFRGFLKEHGLNSPKYYSIKSEKDSKLVDISFPCFVKPVDSSGSKGVSKVDDFPELNNAINQALQFSRCKRVIVEENVETPFKQVHGDGFVYEGELVFLGLCDHHFNGNAPIGNTFPTILDSLKIQQIKKEVAKAIKFSGFLQGAINVEVRINPEGEIVIMEIGPRSGGNYVPQLMECGTGFDEVGAIIDAAVGKKPKLNTRKEINYCFQYILGTKRSGVLHGISFSEAIKGKIKKQYLHREEGDKVYSYKNSSNVIGVFIIQCNNANDLEETFKGIENQIKLKIK